MEEISVDTATRADVPAIVDGWVALATDQRGYGSHILAAENRTTVREHVTHHVVGNRILVARADTVVGFVQVTTEVGSYRMDVDRGVVETLYVDPDYRNQGIGNTLLARAEDTLADRGMDTVGLEVMAENDAAQRFYERCGYDVHRVGMEKSLGSDTH